MWDLWIHVHGLQTNKSHGALSIAHLLVTVECVRNKIVSSGLLADASFDDNHW